MIHRFLGLTPIATLATAACFAWTVASADDWPAYRGSDGDGKSSESIGQVDWSDGPDVIWKAETPLGFSSLAVADGRAFTLVGRSEKGEPGEFCLALDASDGRRLWEVRLGDSDYGHDGGNAGASGNRGGDGPRGTPATDGKRVYVYDGHLVLHCLDAASGNTIWKRDVVREYGGENIKWLNATSPVMDEHRIYVGGGSSGQSFLCFDQEDGTLIWKSGDQTITHATPQLATINGSRQLVFFVKSGLVGVDAASGQQLWHAVFPFSVSTAASPVVSGNLVYCSAGYGVGAGLFRVDGKGEAEEVWFKPNELMNHWSTPLIHDEHLYGLYEFKKYGRAPLQCVDLMTGEIRWSQRGFGPGNCILVGDKLVVLSDAGEVAIVFVRPDEYQELARADVLTGKCWSTPAFADGHIFVRSTEQAVCIRVDDR